MLTIRDAYRAVARVKKGRTLSAALDYDDERYVLCFSRSEDSDWVQVSKKDGTWRSFYPPKEGKRFTKALNNKLVDLAYVGGSK